MDTREVYIEWDGEKIYLGRVDELCGEAPPIDESTEAALSNFIRDVVGSLAFATNEVFPDTVKIIIR